MCVEVVLNAILVAAVVLVTVTTEPTGVPALALAFAALTFAKHGTVVPQSPETSRIAAWIFLATCAVVVLEAGIEPVGASTRFVVPVKLQVSAPAVVFVTVTTLADDVAVAPGFAAVTVVHPPRKPPPAKPQVPASLIPTTMFSAISVVVGVPPL
jgi:hypothetical protein